MLFVDENGQPELKTHKCMDARIGTIMQTEEINSFALSLLCELYESNKMKILEISKDSSGFPFYLMRSGNGTDYFVALKTEVFPYKAELESFEHRKEALMAAEMRNAIPVFAGLSFMNLDSGTSRQTKMVCGGSYFVMCKGLEKL